MPAANLQDKDSPTAASSFQTTHWTLIQRARHADDTAARNALNDLCASYWRPLYAFTRRQGATPHEAEDLTQAFFVHFLDQDALARVEPGLGKFRSYLLVCLKNFLANERARAHAQRRGAGLKLLPLDLEDAERRYLIEPADHRTPEAIYERRWACEVLERALDELRREHASDEERQQFEELAAFLPGGRSPPSRPELAVRRGVTVGAIDVAIHRLRHRFGILLRQQVARTVSSDEEVKQEIRDLISILSG